MYHGIRMPGPLAALRRNLDVMPSPVEDRPGLLLRDPFGYATDVIVIPPPLVPFLRLFDGEHELSELAAALYRATGDLSAPEFARRLVETLGGGGFLENEELARRRQEREREFAGSDRRQPSHAGDAYPEDPRELRALVERWFTEQPEEAVEPPQDVYAIAAPHVSFAGGFRCYVSAYRALPAQAAERTMVVLGTSHYGMPARFGLTRKAYETPLGSTHTDGRIVDWLVQHGGPAVVLEDYCHAVEHSIEFQVIFLQHLLGPAVRVVPVLCGPFLPTGDAATLPERDPGVARFLAALAELAAGEKDLLWVLGVDLAHVGRRYGDAEPARAGAGALAAVEQRDHARLESVLDGDAERFWQGLCENEDDLRWCGASPLYTFLRATLPGRGTLLRYEQWNIDPVSVVSFAALAFGRRATTPGGEGGA